MVVDQNSFIPERPFFANKNFTFAKLSRTPCLSFAGPTLANNTSYEDSFTTCQITPENHGSLLGSLLNMQLASRSPFSGQIFFLQSLLAHPLQHALWLSPALSHNFRGTFAKISLFTDPGPAISRCTEGKAKTRGLGAWLSQSLTFGNLATATRILCCPSPAGPGSGWQPFTYNDYNTQLSRNKILLSRTRKKTFARVSNITCTAFAIKTPYKDL